MPFWPIASIGTRQPVISHEWEGPHKPGEMPIHPGVDIMFRKPEDYGFEIPAIPGGVYARAVVAGTVLYARFAPNGLRVRIRDQAGQDHLYLHLASLSVHPGDFVAAKTRLGLVGYDPSAADPAHVWHLHYALYIKNAPGPKDGRGFAPVDPTPYVKTWQYE